MKINTKILSIPPYLSTSWEYVTALRLQNTDLLVHLANGEAVIVPNLKPDILETIFEHHIIVMEQKDESLSKQRSTSLSNIIQNAEKTQSLSDPDLQAESIFKIGFSSPEGLSAAMHHNPEYANAPDLPFEILQKIGAISKIIEPEDVMIPKAEPHCNCPYCQIARAIHVEAGLPVQLEKKETEELEDEAVCEEELQFQEWNITQSGDKLFTVVNKLDSHEKYSVYLGHPVGCTCGKEGCDHILAVLKS